MLELVARVMQRGGSCLEIPHLSAPDMQSHRDLLGHTEVYQLWISILFICSFHIKFFPLNFAGLRQAINSKVFFSSKYIYQKNRKVKGHLELRF